LGDPLNEREATLALFAGNPIDHSAHSITFERRQIVIDKMYLNWVLVALINTEYQN